MNRRFSINATVVNDPSNFDDFNESIGREGKYKGLFKSIPSVKLRWFGAGKDLLITEYQTYGSAWRDTTLLIERTTDFGTTYTTEFNLTINYEDTRIDYEGEAEFIEVGVKQISILEKFQARDGKEIDLQSLVDMDEGVITAFTDETFDITLDNQIITKKNKFEFNGVLGSGGPSFFSNALLLGTAAYNLPFDTVSENQVTDNFLYPPAWSSWIFGAPPNDLTFPVTNNNFFEHTRINPEVNETYDNVAVGITGDVTVIIVTVVGLPVFKMVYLYEIVDDLGTVTQTANQAVVLPFVQAPATQFVVTLDSNVTFPGISFKKNDRMYAYMTVENAAGTNISFSFTAKPTLTYEYESKFADTTCKVMLIHDYLKRMFQSMTGLPHPIRSDYYGNTNSTYLSGGTPTAYSADGDGAMKGITNVFQIREFPIADEPMVDTFQEFYKFMWGNDTIAIGLEFDGVTPYFRIEPIEYFYDKTTQIFDFSADGFRPKQVPLSVDKSLSYNKIKFGDTNYKDEKFGVLDAINAVREYSIFTESESTKTYDFTIPQITNGTIIELSRRKPFANFEKEDTTYDDNIVVIELRRLTGTTFARDKDQDFTSITGIENSDTVYNLKLTPKRRLLKHLKIIGASLWGAIDNPVAYGNPSILFVSGRGIYGYTTQLTTEGSALDENEDIVINSTNIVPLYTNEIQEFEVPLTLDQRDTLLTINQGYIQTTSRGVVYKIFLDLGDIESLKTGKVRFKGRKLYE